jgi:hypothetical protein
MMLLSVLLLLSATPGLAQLRSIEEVLTSQVGLLQREQVDIMGDGRWESLTEEQKIDRRRQYIQLNAEAAHLQVWKERQRDDAEALVRQQMNAIRATIQEECAHDE